MHRARLEGPEKQGNHVKNGLENWIFSFNTPLRNQSLVLSVWTDPEPDNLIALQYAECAV
jgi:hypothetical protein